jgi:hypothetical protein
VANEYTLWLTGGSKLRELLAGSVDPKISFPLVSLGLVLFISVRAASINFKPGLACVLVLRFGLLSPACCTCFVSLFSYLNEMTHSSPAFFEEKKMG